MFRPQFQRKLLHPKFWPSWFGIGLWAGLCLVLPHPFQLWLGRRLGDLLLRFGGSRSRIAKINIDRCYPEFDEQQRQQLLRSTMQDTAIAIFESGDAWFWPDRRFKNKYRVSGLDHLQHALRENRGIVLLGIHFTTIEIGAAMLNLKCPISGFYRPHRNPVYEYVQARGRVRRNNNSGVIPNGDLRGLIKALRNGSVINYAPDQDYGRRRSTFAPFFNIMTATVKAPAQLASAGNAEIIPWITRRDRRNNRYLIEILPPISDQLGKGEAEDARYINRFVEEQVRKNPEQYLWVHRRFKTRPEGEASFYSRPESER